LTAAREVAAVVPAAGRSIRFGADKLLADYAGKPVAAHVADLLAGMGFGHLLAVCPRGNTARADLFAARGFAIVWNDESDRGLGHSLALGAGRAHLLGASGLLVCLADMPNVSLGHIERMLVVFGEGDAIATEVEGIRMPPALLPRSFFPLLMKLSGDHGAGVLLSSARTVPADRRLAQDIDTPGDLGSKVK
jgi:molybdenum cofactor cytidylyltransferase